MVDINKSFETLNESGDHLINFQPHAIKERKNVGDVLASPVHHHYDNEHIGHTSRKIDEVKAGMKGLGYEHSDMGHGEHSFTKHDKERGVRHDVDLEKVKFHDKLYNVRMNHVKTVVKEDAVPVNNVGGGQVAGLGQGPQGEPGVNPKKKKSVKMIKGVIYRAELNKNARRRGQPWWTDKD